MSGLPFIEAHRLVTRRVYVIDDHSGAEYIDRNVASDHFGVDVVKLSFPPDCGFDRYFALRDLIKRAPPEILRRSIVGFGAGAIDALILSLVASVDEVFALDPRLAERHERMDFNLGLVGNAPAGSTTKRFVMSSFNSAETRKLLPKLHRWTECVILPQHSAGSDTGLSGLVRAVAGRNPIALPSGALRILAHVA